MEKTILRAQVFQEIHSGEPFDMIWITCDRRRGTGGEIISAEGWMVVFRKAKAGETLADQGGATPGASDEAEKIRKDPNHPENGTVNVYNPANSGYHPISVHFDLIQFFNGKRVIN